MNYNCVACSYKTNQKSNYNAHLKTFKHMKNVKNVKNTKLNQNSDSDDDIEEIGEDISKNFIQIQ